MTKQTDSCTRRHMQETIGALIITNTILGVPYCNSSVMGPVLTIKAPTLPKPGDTKDFIQAPASLHQPKLKLSGMSLGKVWGLGLCCFQIPGGYYRGLDNHLYSTILGVPYYN